MSDSFIIPTVPNSSDISKCVQCNRNTGDAKFTKPKFPFYLLSIIWKKGEGSAGTMSNKVISEKALPFCHFRRSPLTLEFIFFNKKKFRFEWSPWMACRYLFNTVIYNVWVCWPVMRNMVYCVPHVCFYQACWMLPFVLCNTALWFYINAAAAAEFKACTTQLHNEKCLISCCSATVI